MARRRSEDVEDDRVRRIEGDRPPPGKRQSLALANLGDERVGRVGIDGFGLDAAEAEDHRLVGRMAPSGIGQRAIKRDPDLRDPADRAALDEPRREGGGRFHRADRVRGGRANADLEKLEDADHRFVPWFKSLRRPAAFGRWYGPGIRRRNSQFAQRPR